MRDCHFTREQVFVAVANVVVALVIFAITAYVIWLVGYSDLTTNP